MRQWYELLVRAMLGDDGQDDKEVMILNIRQIRGRSSRLQPSTTSNQGRKDWTHRWKRGSFQTGLTRSVRTQG